MREALPSLETVVHVPYAGGDGDALPGRSRWDELLGEPGPLEFDPLPFAHPLYVLFSSGTTGLPKAIVHGHGGILLEHLKNHGLSWDMQPGDRLQWFTTTAWMMWNALVSTLLLRASIVMIDGNPGYPDLASSGGSPRRRGRRCSGSAPRSSLACRKEGVEPGRDFDLSSLRSLGVAGSPLPVEGFEWIYDQLGPRACSSTTAAAEPTSAPASSRAIRCCRSTPARSPGAASPSTRLRSTSDGKPVVGELGELVIRQPMPSMPVALLERPRRLALPRRVLRPLPRRLAPRRLDHVHRARQLGDHRPLRRDAEPRRRAARDERAVLGRRGDRGGARQPRRPPGGVGRAAALRRPARRASSSTTRCASASPARCATALSPRHAPDAIVAVPAIPRTLTGQEARAAGQADPHRHRRRRGRQPRRARRPRRDRAVRRLRPHGTCSRPRSRSWFTESTVRSRAVLDGGPAERLPDGSGRRPSRRSSPSPRACSRA